MSFKITQMSLLKHLNFFLFLMPLEPNLETDLALSRMTARLLKRSAHATLLYNTCGGEPWIVHAQREKRRVNAEFDVTNSVNAFAAGGRRKIYATVKRDWKIAAITRRIYIWRIDRLWASVQASARGGGNNGAENRKQGGTEVNVECGVNCALITRWKCLMCLGCETIFFDGYRMSSFMFIFINS